MNDALAVSRWLKFENPTPGMQKDLGPFLRYFTTSLRRPYVLDDGLRVAENGIREIAIQGIRITGYRAIHCGDVRRFVRRRGRSTRSVPPGCDGYEPECDRIHHENCGKHPANRVIVDHRIQAEPLAPPARADQAAQRCSIEGGNGQERKQPDRNIVETLQPQYTRKAKER